MTNANCQLQIKPISRYCVAKLRCRAIVSILILAILTTGCNSASPTAAEVVSGPVRPRALSEESLIYLSGITRIGCEDGICHEAVARLVEASQAGQSPCTASLIGEDIVVTASHCLHITLPRAQGLDCHETLLIQFPQTESLAAEVYRCKRVLYLSPISSDLVVQANNLDLAVIQLESKSSRKPLKLNFNGVPDQKNLMMVSVTSDLSKGEAAIMKKQICRSVQNSRLLAFYNFDFNSTLLLENCPSVETNSGSPILSEDGEELLAVEQSRAIAIDGFEDFNGSEEKLKEFSVASNLACLDIPELNLKANSLCRGYVTSGQIQKVQSRYDSQFADLFNSQFDQLKADWMKSNAQYISWTSSNARIQKSAKMSKAISYPIPSCVKVRALEEAREKKGLSWTQVVPRFEVRRFKDERMQSKAETDMKTVGELHFVLDYKHSFIDRGARLNVTNIDPQLRGLIKKSMWVPFCAQD
jgi:hypothetical protein